MNIRDLIDSRLTVLTEADNTDPDALVSDFLKTTTGNDYTKEADELEAESNQSQSSQQPQSDQQTNEIPNQQNSDNTSQDDENNSQNTDDRYQLDNAETDYANESDSEYDIPKLKILNNLSDTEYKLNNLRCFNQFEDLAKNVENTINNNIMKISTTNQRQRQVVDIVHNNLSSMLEDLNNYMIFRFSDIYEDNILAYVTYLKRYHIAMKIIKLIVDENINNKK